MIPSFPRFKKMSLDDRVVMEKYVSKYLPYSDFNFISLWVYDTEDDIIVSFLNGNLVIRLRDYCTNKHIYTFLGTHKTIETADTLIKWSHTHHGIASLKLVPEDVIHSEPTFKEYFSVEEDPDSFDYILSTSKLSRLEGSDFKSKRKMVKTFCKKYPHHTFKNIDIRIPEVQKEIISLFHTWGSIKKKMPADVQHELTALKRLLAHAEQFHLFTVGIYIEEVLVGFSVVELVHNLYAVNHFMKVNNNFTGISETIDKIVAQKLHEKGYLHFNIEQDLGLPGLKKSKMLCRPVQFLKKYIVSPQK